MKPNVVSVFTILILIISGVSVAQERGFMVGQMLPDISLTDLKGDEVRFSDFLGKQFVIYGWASW
ncbi:MAG: hypothetical protein AAF585_17075 [Verrucomicrobiota bacterium]